MVSIVASSAIPFAVVVGLCVAFAFAFVMYYRAPRTEAFVLTTVSVTLLASLLCVGLVPMDIFIASSTKTPAGEFASWATNSTVGKVDSALTTTYYVLYGVVLTLAFAALPFVFFYAEDEDGDIDDDEEEEDAATARSRARSGTPALSTSSKSSKRACRALKFTIGFLVLFAILMVIGVFVSGGSKPPDEDELRWIKEVITQNRGEHALSFVIGVLTLLGMALMCVYTAIGMSAMPLHLIRGRRKASDELLDVDTERGRVRADRHILLRKYRKYTTTTATAAAMSYGDNDNDDDDNDNDVYETFEDDETTGADGELQRVPMMTPAQRARRSQHQALIQSMSSTDRATYRALERKERLMRTQERRLAAAEQGCLARCCMLLRPFQVIFGVVFALFSLLIIVSILLTSIDKALHGLGPHAGYALPRPQIPNPVDTTLMFLSRAYPLDYVLFCCLVVYLILCTTNGIVRIGIRALWIKLFDVRRARTVAQALVLVVFVVCTVVLALDALLLTIAPQYMAYGTQHYLVNGTIIEQCSTAAPQGLCTLTRVSALYNRFFYSLTFFGVVFYWANWVFIAVFVVGTIFYLMRGRQAAISGASSLAYDSLADDE